MLPSQHGAFKATVVGGGGREDTHQLLTATAQGDTYGDGPLVPTNIKGKWEM